MTKRLLLIDADPVFCEQVTRRFEAAHVPVSSFSDEALALQRARSVRPSLVVLSELPERNLFAVCNRLRRTPELADVPIVLLCDPASEPAIEAHRTSRLPASLYLQRPLDAARLLDEVRALLPPDEEGAAPPTPAEERASAPPDDEERTTVGRAPEPEELRAPTRPAAPGPIPDPFAEQAPEPRPPLAASPEEKLRFFRDRLKARDELIGRARDAWQAREDQVRALELQLAARSQENREAAAARQEAIAAVEAEVAGKTEVIERLERSILTAQQEAGQQRRKAAELQTKLDDAEARAASLTRDAQESLREREASDRVWSDRLAAAEAATAELRRSLEAQLARAREERDAARRDTSEAARRGEELGRELEETQHERDETRQALETEQAARAELETLRSEHESARAELETVRPELEAARAELENLRAELGTLRVELDEVREELAASTTERDELRGELELARANAESSQKAGANADAIAATLAENRLAHEEELRGLRDEATAREQELGVLRDDLETLRDQLAAAEAKAEEAELAAEQHRATADEYEEEMTRLREEVAELRPELEQTRSWLADREQQLEQARRPGADPRTRPDRTVRTPLPDAESTAQLSRYRSERDRAREDAEKVRRQLEQVVEDSRKKLEAQERRFAEQLTRLVSSRGSDTDPGAEPPPPANLRKR